MPSLKRLPATFGKPSQRFMRKVVYKRLGARRSQLLVGPGPGLDNAIARIGPRKVLVSTTDPLSFIPALGPRESAWLSVHLIASDLATSAIAPQYAILEFNLPPEMPDSVFAEYWRSTARECKALGVSILGGHTGRYDGCDYSIIGGGSMLAIASESQYLTPAMARTGDDLILTKGAAIETTAVLVRSFPGRVRKAIGPRLFDKAWNYVRKVSTVQDALVAGSVGIRERGVSAMHDATEGGVLTAMVEMADASGLGLRVDMESVPVSQETASICKLFNIDPLVSLSEGSLIVAARPFATSRILGRLSSRGVPSFIVGRLVSANQGMYLVRNGTASRIRIPPRDPYWLAYSRAFAKGWN